MTTARTCPICATPFPAAPNKRWCSRKCQLIARRAPATGISTVHVVIPDTQVRPGVPNIHMQWIGKYIAARYAHRIDTQVKVIHLGDHWDMPSLSSWDRGKKAMEGRRIREDLDAGNRGWQLLDAPISSALWVNEIERHFLFGNHEDRLTRAVESQGILDGLVGLDDMNTLDWQRHNFLVPVTLDGVVYAHYFYNPMTGRPYSGENLKLRMKTLGHSFTMGHQQTMDHAIRFVNGRKQVGLVAGACYLHDEDYKGPQGNAHWRGIIVCNNVDDGAYDLMEVSMDFLCYKAEGVRLRDYRGPEIV